MEFCLVSVLKDMLNKKTLTYLMKSSFSLEVSYELKWN